MAAPSVNTAVEVLRDSIRFGSLKFAANSAGGLRYVPNFNPDQVIRFGSLQFIAVQLDHLHLRGVGKEVPISRLRRTPPSRKVAPS